MLYEISDSLNQRVTLMCVVCLLPFLAELLELRARLSKALAKIVFILV